MLEPAKNTINLQIQRFSQGCRRRGVGPSFLAVHRRETQAPALGRYFGIERLYMQHKIH